MVRNSLVNEAEEERFVFEFFHTKKSAARTWRRRSDFSCLGSEARLNLVKPGGAGSGQSWARPSYASKTHSKNMAATGADRPRLTATTFAFQTANITYSAAPNKA